VDGTKLRANASRKSLYDAKRIERERAFVGKVLAEADAADAADDAAFGDGDGTPEELRDPEKRKAKLDEIERRLKESGKKHLSTSDPDSRLIRPAGHPAELQRAGGGRRGAAGDRGRVCDAERERSRTDGAYAR